MKKDFLEVRWCGRGGQGAVTAAKMLAESALDEGKFIQAFPEFGPERMGAPVRSFTRISSKPIVVHCQIVEPDISVLLDPTLLDVVDITEGVPKNGIIIVNTTDSPGQLRQKMGLVDRKLFTVDATGISTKIMGRNVPNTPMVGAVVKVSGAVKLDSVIRNFQQEFSHKFKEEVIRTNIEAIKLAYEQTKGEGQ